MGTNEGTKENKMKMKLIKVGNFEMSLDVDKVIYVTPVNKGALIKFTNGEFQIIKDTSVEEVHNQLAYTRKKRRAATQS